jgi:hypothetical protein
MLRDVWTSNICGGEPPRLLVLFLRKLECDLQFVLNAASFTMSSKKKGIGFTLVILVNSAQYGPKGQGKLLE